jgi:spore photoproduct lyase
LAKDGINVKTLVDKFDRLFIDEKSKNSKLVERLLATFPANKVEWVTKKPFPLSRGDLSAAEFDRSKKNLFITEFAGHFFKRCPGSKPGLLCCNYFVLNWGQQCDMNCSYCYLQSFINNPVMTLYSNLDKAFAELREIARSMGKQKLRVGTGETVDSLSLDPLTHFARDIIVLFREFPHWTVEFKTKSSFVDQFLDVEHGGNAIVSWSLNPQPVITAEEHGTASLEERLAAAERCLKKDFPVGFHLDPVIYHAEWEKNYDTLVDEICRRFSPKQIPFMSIGALRFQPEQRHLMRERFGMKSFVTSAEMFPSADGKLRYPVALRTQMFERIRQRFLNHDPAWKIFLCMETPETWAARSPFKEEELHDLFDPKIARSIAKTQQSLGY